jgi:hypothetical protein
LKPLIFLLVLFILALIIPLAAFLMQPSPIIPFDRAQAVWWLRYDQQIHTEWLSKPDLHNGNRASHQKWIDDFEQIINRIEKRPSKLTTEQCIQLLRLAQASHVGDDSKDYAVIVWHWEWYTVYEKIIDYMER